MFCVLKRTISLRWYSWDNQHPQNMFWLRKKKNKKVAATLCSSLNSLKALILTKIKKLYSLYKPVFSYPTSVVWWCRCCLNLSLIGQKLPCFKSWTMECLEQRLKCLAQGYNTVPIVSLKLATFDPKSNTLPLSSSVTPQGLEVRSFIHLYSHKTKSSQCHYVVLSWAFGFEAI